MKKYKIFLFVFSLISISIYWQLNKNTKQGTEIVDNQDWITVKKQNQKVVISPSTDKELNLIQVKKGDDKNRQPSSVKPKSENKIVNKKNRIIGPDSEKIDQLPFTNRLDKQWRERLGVQLMRFQAPETKVFIRPQGSYIKAKNNKATYIQKVLITYLNDTGERNSFNAYIDSESGKVLQTWNKTIHMNKQTSRASLKAVPME